MNTRQADVDRAGSVPLYLQVAQLVRQDIMTGKYQTGHMLPGEHAMTGDYGVSPYTVRRAIEVLRQEGLVETRRGAGTQVLSVPPQISVRAGPLDEIYTRMPTRAEREQLRIAEGVPILVIRRPGRREEIFDGSRARVEIVS